MKIKLRRLPRRVKTVKLRFNTPLHSKTVTTSLAAAQGSVLKLGGLKVLETCKVQ